LCPGISTVHCINDIAEKKPLDYPKNLSENFRQSIPNYELVLKDKMIKILSLKKAKCQKFRAKIVLVRYAEHKRKDGE
jgi:hypothetical protein